MSGNYSKETRERAVWLVWEHSGDYASEWAVISAGCHTAEHRQRGGAAQVGTAGRGRPGGSRSDDSGVEGDPVLGSRLAGRLPG
jgi:hypothetical protein